MRKYIFILISIISLQACKNENQELDKLRRENELLKNTIEHPPINATKFVWTIINYKVGDWSPERGFYNLKDRVFWSDIEEVNSFDDNLKYKMQDKLEKKCRSSIALLESVQKRETFVFDSYKEASEFKFKTVNK